MDKDNRKEIQQEEQNEDKVCTYCGEKRDYENKRPLEGRDTWCRKCQVLHRKNPLPLGQRPYHITQKQKLELVKSKVCTRCGKEKSLEEFPIDKNTKTRRSSWCKECYQNTIKEWIKGHPERWKQTCRQSFRKAMEDPEKKRMYKERSSESTKRIRRENRKRMEVDPVFKREQQAKAKKYSLKFGARYSWYKSHDKKKELPFDLTLEQFKEIVISPCYYCNGTVERQGVDRLDPAKGYIKDNCVSCCGNCNYMKWTFTLIEFKERLKKVYENLKKKEG